jgi:hypothetical protein
MRALSRSATVLTAVWTLQAQTAVPYADVRPVLEALREQLPPELKGAGPAKWNAWSRQRDKAIRARLEQGDLDSLVNLLLFGTSFTNQPRIRIEDLAEASRTGLLRARAADLVDGLRAPASNERLLFARNLLRSKGIEPDSAGVFLFRNLERVLKELNAFAQRAEQAKASGAEFAERSRLFRDRGVSLDTSWLPNLGIEQALRELKDAGLQVRRAAVIGPGLDFADWDAGYDYYPLQTLQPFALYDSLLRLELAAAPAITVFDISPRPLAHLNRARGRARNGQGYDIQLPLDPARGWPPAAVEYWSVFGDRAGTVIPPIPPPAELAGLETRAVRIRPAVVLACEPVDLNVVLGRWSGAPFDLIIATNVFVYYDVFEQALALQNAGGMLKQGGYLLTNSELREVPGGRMRPSGSTRASYGDRILRYQKR